MRSRIALSIRLPPNCLLAGFTNVLDIRDSEIGVFTAPGLFLFFFLVLFAHLRAGYRDLVPEMLGEIDVAAAVKPVAVSVFTSDRILAGFIAFLQAAGYGYTLPPFRFRLIFL